MKFSNKLVATLVSFVSTKFVLCNDVEQAFRRGSNMGIRGFSKEELSEFPRIYLGC